MSAYVVSAATMGRVVNGLYAFREELRYCSAPILDRALNDGPVALAALLYEHNSRAVRGRYPSDPEMSEIPAYRHEPVAPRNVNRIQALKSLQCLVYQCAEDATADTELQAELNRVEQAIAVRIVMTLPEYNAATWG